MKFVLCIVARTNSSRLPHKVLLKVNNKRMIEWIVWHMKNVANVDSTYIATSDHPDDNILLDIASKHHIKSFAGSETSVIDRLLDIAARESADYIIRVTGDNIFTDPVLLSKLVEYVKLYRPDYARVEGTPIGVTAEVISLSALKDCYRTIDPKLSEYLMLYLYDPTRYRTLIINVSTWVPPYLTLTVDTPCDWERTKFIFKSLSHLKIFTLKDILSLELCEKIPFFRLDPSSFVKLPNGCEAELSVFMAEHNAKRQYVQTCINLDGDYNVIE